eukprot:GHVU01154713.1.p2 GENE.GHVU01154713.1~~GHVU01154713.1.p2  ORF type:complete len:110 (-),score=4.67 GHVU01154713.1:503-832(-)
MHACVRREHHHIRICSAITGGDTPHVGLVIQQLLVPLPTGTAPATPYRYRPCHFLPVPFAASAAVAQAGMQNDTADRSVSATGCVPLRCRCACMIVTAASLTQSHLLER